MAFRPALNGNMRRVACTWSSITVLMPSRTTNATAGASIQSKRESVRVKKEKVKQEKVKEKRRTETPVDEDSHGEEQETNDVEDDGTDCENENHEGHVSPRGNKRRRMNGEGVSGATEGNGQPELTLLKVKTLPRGADGCVLHKLFTLRYLLKFRS